MLAYRACCEANPEYKEATLTFNLPRLLKTREDVEATVIHELLHCLVWRIAAYAESLCDGEEKALAISSDHEESLTTRLEQLVLGLHPRRNPESE